MSPTLRTSTARRQTVSRSLAAASNRPSGPICRLQQGQCGLLHLSQSCMACTGTKASQLILALMTHVPGSAPNWESHLLDSVTDQITWSALQNCSRQSFVTQGRPLDAGSSRVSLASLRRHLAEGDITLKKHHECCDIFCGASVP